MVYFLVRRCCDATSTPMVRTDIKQTIRQLLEQNDLKAVAALVLANRGVMSQLVRMAYERDTLVGWRAIKAIGFAARALVYTDAEFLRITMRKLLWSLSDESGGIGWAAPEILGEIVSADPPAFSDIIPLIAEVYEIEEKVFRPGVVYALARIAESSPERVACFQKIVITALSDNEPLVRIYALDLIGILNNKTSKSLWSEEYYNRIAENVCGLRNDKKVAWIYYNNSFIDIQVGEKADEICSMMKK